MSKTESKRLADVVGRAIARQRLQSGLSQEQVAERLARHGIMCAGGHFYAWRLMEALGINPGHGVGVELAPEAIVTVELAHNEDIVPPTGFEQIDERRYGAAKIVILRRTS